MSVANGKLFLHVLPVLLHSCRQYSYSVFAPFLRQRQALALVSFTLFTTDHNCALFHLISLYSHLAPLTVIARRTLPLLISPLGRWRWMLMWGRSPLHSAALSENLIWTPGASAFMQQHHPKAKGREEEHCAHNFMGSRVAYDPCYMSLRLALPVIFIGCSLVLK